MSRRQISMEEVLLAIEEFESRYGLPTERRREIAEGDPCFNDDLLTWDELVWVRDRGSARTA